MSKSMNISEMVRSIREEHNEKAPGIQQELHEVAQRKTEMMEPKYCELLSQCYTMFDQVIHESCGTGASISLQIDSLLYNSSCRQDLINYCMNEAGLEVKFSKILFDKSIIVEITENAKVYSYCMGEGSVTLDFRQLQQDRMERIQWWDRYLPKFAESIISEIRQYFEELPSRFYGLQWTTKIKKSGYFSCDGFRFRYSTLSEGRRRHLEEMVNSKINKAKVTIYGNDDGLSLEITYDSDRIIQNPQFDFGEYYNKYSKVTNETRAVFDYICQNLRLSDEKRQLEHMRSDYTLYFWFHDSKFSSDFTVMKKCFHGRNPQLKNLVDYIQERHPELTIKGVKFTDDESTICRRINYKDSLNERIEFDYVIVDDSCRFLAPQCTVDKIINQTINNSAQIEKIAKPLAESILSMIREQNLLEALLRTNYSSRVVDSEQLKVGVKVDNVEWAIDFGQIWYYDEFRKRVEEAITSLTDGLLSVDLNKKFYKLNLSCENPHTS